MFIQLNWLEKQSRIVFNIVQLLNTHIDHIPGCLTEVSVPDVVREDALGLVLQDLHAPGLGQPRRLRLEEDDGLHAAALGGVRRHVAEPESS